jgi:hypothetical protein
MPSRYDRETEANAVRLVRDHEATRLGVGGDQGDLDGSSSWWPSDRSTARSSAPCWYRHETLIRVLAACRDAYLTAYDSSQVASAAADWMHVWDATQERLRRWVLVSRCRSGKHPRGSAATVGAGRAERRGESRLGIRTVRHLRVRSRSPSRAGPRSPLSTSDGHHPSRRPWVGGRVGGGA